jgi:hypothetical protein
MNELKQVHNRPDHDRDGPRQGRSSYWKFAHRDWRFWVGLILIFGSMFIYLATEDLSLRPRLQSAPPSSLGPVAK